MTGRVIVACVAAAIAIAGGGLLGARAMTRPGTPAWQPGSIDNLVLQAGPGGSNSCS